MNILASDYPLLNVFWTMLAFFLFFIWIWLLITVIADVFRSHDLSGGVKALWLIFIIFLPYLGVFIYLIARGGKMQEHAVGDAQSRLSQLRAGRRGVRNPEHRRRAVEAGRSSRQGRDQRRGVRAAEATSPRLTNFVAPLRLGWRPWLVEPA